MSRRGTALWRAGAVALAAVAVDQLAKGIVRAEILPGERIHLAAGVDLVNVSNDGIAFGLLDEVGVGVIVLAAVGFAALLAYFLMQADRPGLWFPIGLLAGGALGNLIDRIARGSVTDFIDPPRWPAFNLADTEITIGVVLLVLIFMREPERTSDDGEPGESPAPEPPDGHADGLRHDARRAPS